MVLQSENLAERATGLPQGKIKRRALERPATVVLETVGIELGRVLRDRRSPELTQPWKVVVRVRGIGHVLTLAGLAEPLQGDGRRHACEVGRHGRLTSLRAELVERQFEPGDGVVETHRVTLSRCHSRFSQQSSPPWAQPPSGVDVPLASIRLMR